MYNKSVFKGLKTALFLIPCLVTFQASADIVISGTRIVYPQASKDVIVDLDNRGNKPLLVQTWLDDGREDVDPQELKLPFVITPPVSRIDPKKGQSVRITYMGKPLPQDRESLFWFNVLEIPPKSKAKGSESLNQLQLAFRTRIKFFFRPEGLKGSPLDAADNVTWTQKTEGNNVQLIAHNASPYNVAISAVTLKTTQRSFEVEHKSILPFGDIAMTIKGLSSTASGNVLFETINDSGGVDKHEAIVK